MRRIVLLLMLTACGQATKTMPCADEACVAALPPALPPTPVPPGPHVESCTPAVLSCDGTRVMQCNAEGSRREPVLDCSANPLQSTCGACASAPACVSPEPLVAGTISGFGAPWLFSTSGCNEFEHEASIVGEGKRAFILELGGGPFRKLRVVVDDLSRVFPGADVGFLGEGTAFFVVEDARGNRCYPYIPSSDPSPPPWSGRASFFWDSLEVGELFTIDFDGPIACSLARNDWVDVHGHIEARITAVE